MSLTGGVINTDNPDTDTEHSDTNTEDFSDMLRSYILVENFTEEISGGSMHQSYSPVSPIQK